MKLKLKVVLSEEMLASAPSNPEVYKDYVASKVDESKKEEEVALIPAEKREQIGWSVFRTDEKGLMLMDYHVRGFFKEAATCVTGKGITAVKSKIDKWLFVFPRKLYLKSPDGKIIKKPEDKPLERPLKAMTMQGPRVSLKRSDVVPAGTYFECEIKVLPLGESELTEKILRSWLDYGQYQGFGEWRNASYGRFKFELEMVEPPEKKKEIVDSSSPKKSK